MWECRTLYKYICLSFLSHGSLDNRIKLRSVLYGSFRQSINIDVRGHNIIINVVKGTVDNIAKGFLLRDE